MWRQNDPTLWAKRGYALIQLMRYDAAVTSLYRPISLKPENAEAYNVNGVALFYKGIVTQSVQSVDAAADAAPLFINPRNNKAFVLAR